MEFVKKGGTLVDFGGMPIWNAALTKDGVFRYVRDYPSWKDRRRLRIQEDAWWMGDKSLPEEMNVFATPEAAAAGR